MVEFLFLDDLILLLQIEKTERIDSFALKQFFISFHKLCTLSF